MKRALLITVALALTGCAAIAGELQREIISVTSWTNAATAVTTTNTNIRGWIDTIDFDVITAGTTGTLTVAVSPESSTLVSVTLATETACAADKSYRPRFDGTDTAGSALTSDDPWPYAVCGDAVTFTVSDCSATGITFEAVIKYYMGE